jgi:hypothetical protein
MPNCGCDRYKRKKDDGDDNATNGSEPMENRGKKKVNIVGPVRVAWYFSIIPQLKYGSPQDRRPDSCIGIRRA